MKITLQIVEIFLEFRNLLFWKAVVLRLLIVCNLRFVIFILLFLCCHFRPRLWPWSLSLFVFQTLYFFLILIDIYIHLLFIIISSSFLALQLTRWLNPCIFWNASLLLIYTLLFYIRLIKLVWHDLYIRFYIGCRSVILGLGCCFICLLSILPNTAIINHFNLFSIFIML